MADNLSQKSHKTSEKNKYNNSITRTTSESLRLNDTEKGNSHPTSLQSASHNSRKISSFQITSVTVGSRVSTDAGEDSADDLDESHTDDISRITDLENETPSFSEDTFSKDDVFYNASSASLGCAPVIPTSSQYGLAIVGQDANNSHPGGVATLNNSDVGEMHVSVTNSGTGSIYNIIGNSKPSEGMKEIQEQVRNERFKVVKIESTEPFRRGRWMCMDYLDHTTTQPSATLIVNNVENQTDTSSLINAPDSGVVLNDSLHEDSGASVDSLKPSSKELQLSNSHSQHDPHSFPVASPGQSLTQPLNMMQTPQSVPVPVPQQPAPATVQSPPIEMPQQLNQNQAIQSGQPTQAQSMTHIPHPAPSSHPSSQQPSQPVQQMTQSFPAHQLQQVIAQSQGMPQMQQMQMHQQMPPQQMQQMTNQQAQMQQIQGQHLAHNTQQMSGMQQMQQMPQMQPIQNQGQMQQLSGQQAPMQQMQMPQMSNQQVSGQAMHQVHSQQPTMQAMPQQVHQMQNQQTLPNQQSQMQHMSNQSQMQHMQTQQTHQMQNHIQQMQQMPQMSNQSQGMSSMPMHQMPSQQGQVNNQSGQVQQQHNIHQQHGIQHGGVQYPQGNQPGMMQQQMSSQSQHMPQQVSSQVQSQHSVPQYYQQPTQLTQGQSLTQEVMATIVNSQQGATLPNNIQNINSQPQGATLPNNLQGINTQQSSGMHPINQQSQSMPQNMQMMPQNNQNIPMAMDSNQGNMQMPVSDTIYMQSSNVNQQMPMNQHMGAQQNIINQQVGTSNTQGQLPMGHVISTQQGMSVGGQSNVMNQNNISGMQQGQSMTQQMPQVSMPNVPQQQQPSQPIIQNMVPPTQQNVVQNIPMSMQQNHPGTMQPAVHSVPTSVVQSQSTMHPQVGLPMGGFNSQSSVGSIQQNVTPAMSQTTITAPMGMQNTVNNPMDIHITQQNICSTATATQPIMSNTSSPVVSLLVNSSMSYPSGSGPAPSGGDSFGSPVSGVVSHVVNSTVNTVSAVVSGEGGSSESGGGTPASDGAQQASDVTDTREETPNNEDSESFNGLALALGGRPGSNVPSRVPSPLPQFPAATHADLHGHNNSASGTSAVAIDNKIEQAMDLVKSHLMFAVREEVEVLKEKIAELMERINQLELENSILKQHATQETLAQLSPAPPSPPSGPVS